jgi:hypothetical protein
VSEVSLYRLRPRARFGARPSLLSQNGEDGCRGLPDRARGKQPKAPNSVLRASRNVLGPAVNERFQGALHLNLAQVWPSASNSSQSRPGIISVCSVSQKKF